MTVFNCCYMLIYMYEFFDKVSRQFKKSILNLEEPKIL